MNLELHIIQSFAPSNLNRDDTGSPKECEFGGVRRARFSSQCWKRSIRLAFEHHGLLKESLAVRTRKIGTNVAEFLVTKGKDPETARAIADNALSAIGLGAGKNGDSQYLLFVPRHALHQFAQACLTHADLLSAKKKAGKKEDAGMPKDALKSLEVLLREGRAADLGLFGRMIADKPEHNLVAASQVAHAMSTHKVDLEFDFFTAVDDLQPEGETGAGMMGTVEYNSACFYRYANVDLEQLRRNLGGDTILTAEAVSAFLQASIDAIPTGKQNSMAAQNPPSLVFAVLRDSGLWSLANAFLKPVRANGGDDLVQASIAALADYWGKLAEMYGEPAGLWLGASTLHPEAFRGASGKVVMQPVQDLVRSITEHCSKAFAE